MPGPDEKPVDCANPGFDVETAGGAGEQVGTSITETSTADNDEFQLYAHIEGKGNSPMQVMKRIDSGLHCFSGGVRKFLGYLIFGAMMCVPLLCAGLMVSASYDVYHNEKTCSGPELVGGMLQSIWWMYFWWTMVGLMILGSKCMPGECALIFIATPYCIMALVLAAPFVPNTTGDDGTIILIIAAIILVCMLIGMILWPFLAPLIIASQLKSRMTWVRYYNFKLFYNGLPFAEVNPGNTTQWPLDNEMYQMPERSCYDKVCTGGWSAEAPRGITGLLEDMILPNQEPSFCSSNATAPGFIRSLLLGMNSTIDLNTVQACDESFTYNASLSNGRDVFVVDNMPATFCSIDATMPQCCNVVRSFFASQSALFFPLTLVLLYLAIKTQSRFYFVPAALMVIFGGAGFGMALDIVME